MTFTDWNVSMSLTSDDSLEAGLYICPTPIGNLEDITLRVLKVLALADIVAAEDTRHSIKLLNHYGLKKKLLSYHEHNLKKRGPEIIDEIRGGKAIALISDAGMPGISDPGADILRLCVEESLPVVVLPGPTASITALVASGLRTDRFTFWGFPERQGGRRKDQLEAMLDQEGTAILYESPHRIESTLKDLLAIGGDRPIVLAREITKRYEEYLRGDLTDVIARIGEGPVKGELVLLFEGSPGRNVPVVNEESRLKELLEKGLPTKEISRILAKETGKSRKSIYQSLIQNEK